MALFGGLKKKIENLKNEISIKTASLDKLLEKAEKATAEQNYDKAFLFYTKAAEQGNADAQNSLGVCYANGNGVTQDYTEAVKWWRRSAEQGFAKAQNNLGVCYEKGNGVTQDYTEAVKWYRKAAEQGHADAQYNLGECYYYGNGVTKDYTEAVKWYRKAAEQGDASAQYSLGYCYEHGNGVTKDYTEAVKWYRKAAKQGDAPAQRRLGVCYKNGKGVTQDYTEAVKWYRKAAKQGDACAQNNLGKCYYTGNGVTQDYTEAVKWFRKAAEQGYADAQNSLGVCYYTGYGVTQDYTEAVKWYRKAAEQGYASAQRNLGVCYHHGDGICKDLQEALKWYQKANDDFSNEQIGKIESVILSADELFEKAEKLYSAKEYDSAIGIYHVAAKKGNAESMNKLGLIYSSNEETKHFWDPSYSFHWFKKSAEKGNAQAQKKLGECYQYGNGTRKDLQEALKWYQKANDDYSKGKIEEVNKEIENDSLSADELFEKAEKAYSAKEYKKAIDIHTKAAEKGNTLSMNKLGHIYYDEETITYRDYDKAFNWFKKSAENGNADSQGNLGTCYQYGYGTSKDLQKAMEWFLKLNTAWAKEKVAEVEDGLSVYELYDRAEDARSKNDLKNAIRLHTKSAEKGYDKSMNELAHIYSDEKTKQYRDYDKCFYWFKKSAENGNVNSQDNLGWCYHYGHGTSKNLQEALKWYQKANTDWSKEKIAQVKEEIESKMSAEDLYEKAEEASRNKDWDTAIRLHTKAATTGYVNSMNALANIYSGEKDYKLKDMDKCSQWAAKSAEQGNAEGLARLGKCSQYNTIAGELLKDINPEAKLQLGMWFEHGENGLPKDLEKAIYWYQQAAVAGNKLALTFVQTLSQVKQKMDEEGAGDDYTFRWTDKYGDRQEGERWLTKDEYLALLAGGESAIKAYIKSHFYGTSAGVNNVKMFKNY